jgi:hypothetical protein
MHTSLQTIARELITVIEEQTAMTPEELAAHQDTHDGSIDEIVTSLQTLLPQLQQQKPNNKVIDLALDVTNRIASIRERTPKRLTQVFTGTTNA